MARAQLHTIVAVVETLDAAHIRTWLFGGWGLDARVGRLTRDHSDIETLRTLIEGGTADS